MTYRDLYFKIRDMTAEQKSMTVTILDCEENEFYGVNELEFTDDSDVLDEYHPILLVKE